MLVGAPAAAQTTAKRDTRLVDALKAGDTAAAQAAVADADKGQKEGHKEFRKQKEKK